MRFCQENSDYEKLRFVVYKDGNIIGALSYNDILNNRTVKEKCINASCEDFRMAIAYFGESGLIENACVPVCNANEKLMFLLEYHQNRMFGIHNDGWVYEGK
ncbi:MAG: hypothetical protein IJA34_05000 [Lachnospiraceae bacterium]|nr:hypothetical protein [Lachnospiraceae bacterium]